MNPTTRHAGARARLCAVAAVALAAGASARAQSTYYLTPSTGVSVAPDGQTNLPAGNSTSYSNYQWRTRFTSSAPTGTTTTSMRTAATSTGAWVSMARVYLDPYVSGSTLSAVPSASVYLRAQSSSDSYQFFLLDFDPSGAAQNGTVVAQSGVLSNVDTSTATRYAVTFTAQKTFPYAYPSGHRLVLEVKFRPASGGDVGRVYLGSTSYPSSLVVQDNAACVPGATVTIPDGQLTGANPIDVTTLYSSTGTAAGSEQYRIVLPQSDAFAALDASRWTLTDINGSTPAGTATASGRLTLTGGGNNIGGGSSDQFAYLWQPWTDGDFTIDVDVLSFTSPQTGGKAGIVVRQDLSAGAAMYAVLLRANADVLARWRAYPNQNTTDATTTGVSAPRYLRLVRSGNTFSAWHSADGVSFAQIPGSTQTISLNGSISIGLGVTSLQTWGPAAVGAFDDFVVTNATSSGWTSAATPLDTTTWAGGTYSLMVRGTDDTCGTGVSALNSFTFVTTSVGDGVNPGRTAVCFDGPATPVDAFTLATTAGTDTVSSVDVQLSPAGSADSVARIDVTDDTGSTVYGTLVGPTTDLVTVLLSGIPAAPAPAQFQVVLTPAAAPVYGNYAVQARVVAATANNKVVLADANSGTLRIDDAPPADVTGLASLPGNGKVTLNWQNPTADFQDVLVLWNTGTISDQPVQGHGYVAGNTIGTSVVGFAGLASSATVAGLTNGTTYYFKVFARDPCGTWSAGVQDTETPSLTVPVTYYAVPDSGTAIPGDGTTNLPSGQFASATSTTPVTTLLSTTAPTNSTDSVMRAQVPGGASWTLGALYAPAYAGATLVEANATATLYLSNNNNNNWSYRYQVTLCDFDPSNGSCAAIGSAQTIGPVSSGYSTFTVAFGNGQSFVAKGHRLRLDVELVNTSSGSSTTGYLAVGASHLDHLDLKETPALVTVGDGTNPGASSLCAISTGAQMMDAFTLQTNAGTDWVSAVTVQLAPAGAWQSVGKLEVTNDAGTVVYGAVSNPTADSIVVPLGTRIGATRTSTQYKLRVTPRQPSAHGTYAVGGTVTGLASSFEKIYADSASGTVTLDDQPAGDVTAFTAAPASQRVALSWLVPAGAAQVLVLQSQSPISFTPVDGATYAGGATVAAGVTVAYAGTGTGLTVTGLTNGQNYYFKAFTRDSCSLYSTGVQVGPAVPNITITAGEDGTEPPNRSIGPGSPAVLLDAFSLVASEGSGIVTGVTVSLSPGSAAGVAKLEVVSRDGSTVYGSASPASDVVTIPLSPAQTIGTTASGYRIRLTPMSATAMPAPPGQLYAVTGTVTGLATTLNKAYADLSSALVTIDNASPANPVLAPVAAGDKQLALSWTKPGDGDLAGILILRGGAPIAVAPTEGVSYAVGAAIGTATVVYNGNGTGFTDTGLVNGTAYYYRAFAYDGYRNHSTGASAGPAKPVTPVLPVTPGLVTATAQACNRVTLGAAYTGDTNWNSTTTFSRGSSSTGPWTTVCGAVSGASPRACTDAGATAFATNWYQVSLADPDGVSGPNPQVVSAATQSCSSSLTIAAGSMKAAGNVQVGSSGNEVAQLALSAAPGPVTLTSLSVQNLAAAPAASPGSDVQSLGLIDVTTGNLVGVSSYDDGAGRYVFRGLSYQVSGTATLMLVLNVAPGANPGDRFQARISQAEATVDGNDLVAPGTPFSGSLFTITASQPVAEGDPTPKSQKPMVSILDPGNGTSVSGPFRVQVRVFTPVAPITAVELSLDNGATWPYALTGGKNANYVLPANAAIYETTLSLSPRSYSLRARATNSDGTTNTGTVVSAVAQINVLAPRRGDGNLLVRDNSNQLCTDCHALKTHSSEAVKDPKTRLSAYGSWATNCRDCHTPHATTNVYLVRPKVTPPAYNGPQPSRAVTFLDAGKGDSGTSATVSFVTSDPAKVAAGVLGPCQVCHTRTSDGSAAQTPRWRSTGNSDTHYAGSATQACIDCHNHGNGFSGRESNGGTNCSGCHATAYKGMNGTIAKNFKHGLGASRGANDSFQDSGLDWSGVSQLSANGPEVRSCVNMCHQDHVHNPPSSPGNLHASNVHQDASAPSTRAVTRDADGNVTGGTPGPAATDFDNAAANGGMCISCHRKPIDSAHPALDRSSYNASAHNYTSFGSYGAWGYTQHDGSTFNRNCTKCHADRGDGRPNDATRPFGAVHYSDYPSLLAGATSPSGNRGLFVCYNCHGDGTNGTFNLSGKNLVAPFSLAYRHPAETDAVHDSAAEARATWASGAFSGAKRHSNCIDCHDPHQAGRTAHSATAVANASRNLIRSVSPLNGATGVQLASWPALWTATGAANFSPTPVRAAKEYELCLKCHSSFAFGATPPTGPSGDVETDVAMEFNPNNRSGHPVVVGLGSYPNSPAPKALAAAQLLPPWNTNMGSQTMYCSDCHGTSAAAPAVQGPHGSAAEYLLTGANKAWPFSSGTTPFALGTTANLFCMNCHPDPRTTNQVHREGDHSGRACGQCHLAIPHGGKMSRLIAAPTAPARYFVPGIDATRTIKMFRKGSTMNSYSESNCQSACAGDHSGAVTGGETW